MNSHSGCGTCTAPHCVCAGRAAWTWNGELNPLPTPLPVLDGTGGREVAGNIPSQLRDGVQSPVKDVPPHPPKTYNFFSEQFKLAEGLGGRNRFLIHALPPSPVASPLSASPTRVVHLLKLSL